MSTIDTGFHVGNRIKEKKDLTKQEWGNVVYLRALVNEYETRYKDIPEYADKKQKLVVRISDLESSNKGQVSELPVAERFELADKLLGNLKKHYDHSKTAAREVFLVADEANRIGVLIKNQRSVRETIRHYLGTAVRNTDADSMLEPLEISNLADIWLDYKECVAFETFGGFGADTWCLGRCLYRPTSEPLDCAQMPTWMNFLSRMNDSEAFAAWIYGLASKRYKGRQVLWFYGPNGEDGKTFIQKLVATCLFPNVHAAVTNSALSNDSQRFVAAEFEDKTLAYWDDCNNQMALFTEIVKQLSAGSSGAKARIEGKGAGAYTGQLETRLWINSNYPPRVSGDNFITSRLLYVTIDKLEEEINPNIGEQFKEQFPQFLKFGKQCYEKLCKDDYKIVQNGEVQKQIVEMGDEFELKFIEVFEDNFEETKDPNDYVLAATVSHHLSKAGIVDNRKVGDWYEWLKKRHQGQPSQKRVSGKNTRVVLGIKKKNAFNRGQEGVTTSETLFDGAETVQ